MRTDGGSLLDGIYDVPADVVAIVLSEPGNQPAGATWTLYVDVHVGEGGFHRLGAMKTRPLVNRAAPSRVVAAAACPGAVKWRITGVSSVPNASAEVFVSGKPSAGGIYVVGLFPNDPRLLGVPVYTPDAENANW